jgi:16S rRNA (guanine527-N7)-methyltransferase
MFHVKPGPQLPPDHLSDLSEAARSKLEAYHRLLEERGVRIGVLSARDAERIWERHILDSLRALACIRAVDRDVVDLGSGGGLPGIPVAIARPDLTVTLVESRSRRAAFLEMAVESLSLGNVLVQAGRADRGGPDHDLCLARAFGDLKRSWDVASVLLRAHGALVYFAGASWFRAAEPTVRFLSEAGLRLEVCSPNVFPWQGPLVIMTRMPQMTP